MTELAGKRVLVTGGTGFLGPRVCALLRARDVGAVIVPRRAQYDLTEQADVRRLFATERPDIVVHLAAVVGGIGANRVNPGRYFYANMAMGLHIIEACRFAGLEKIVQIGHGLLLSEAHAGAVSERRCGTAIRRRRTRPTA